MTFPWVAERVNQGSLALHGWYFDLGRGALLALRPGAGHRFLPFTREALPAPAFGLCDPVGGPAVPAVPPSQHLPIICSCGVHS